jgi:hypothetical protein
MKTQRTGAATILAMAALLRHPREQNPPSELEKLPRRGFGA